MRLAFLGTGRFAVPSLEALAGAGYEIAAVISQPDKPRGRGRELAPPPVKQAAVRLGLPLRQPPRIREAEALEALGRLGAELHVVVAYGQILPRAALQMPARGTINVHASLLPRYRGAAPIQWAIVEGEQETGVTTMLLDEGMDTGPILLQRASAIGPQDTAGELEARLARDGAALLLETLAAWASGRIVPLPQDPARASHARLLSKEDGRIRWDEAAAAIERKVRGFHPWPGATTRIAGRALRLLRASVEAGRSSAVPGEVLSVDSRGVLVACQPGGPPLLLLEVQPESRRAMPAAAFAAGARLANGQRLG